MNRALRRRHRRLWAVLVVVLAMVGALAWRAAAGRGLAEQALARVPAPSPAPLGDAVP